MTTKNIPFGEKLENCGEKEKKRHPLCNQSAVHKLAEAINPHPFFFTAILCGWVISWQQSHLGQLISKTKISGPVELSAIWSASFIPFQRFFWIGWLESGQLEKASWINRPRIILNYFKGRHRQSGYQSPSRAHSWRLPGVFRRCRRRWRKLFLNKLRN